ncbi:MAG: alkene reductase [Rubrivivax sp.]|nr:alkene reductase [Rubrivivax sp.]
MPTLFDPFRLGDIEVATRLVMAPLTRNRAGPGHVPTPLMAEYYAQRADPSSGAGLLITEATPISQQGQGYADTPGLWTAEQVRGWRRVTDAVHARGGRIVVQLWHVGRISHVSLQPGGAAPVSSTARRAAGRTWLRHGMEPVSEPRALRGDEIPGIVQDYARAASAAMDAGFDGVEVHGANGYLIEQFLRASVNDRSDEWGGSPENRRRFLLAVVEAVAAAIGAARTGLRLSPVTPANDAGADADAQSLYTGAAAALAPLGLAYLHVVEGATGGPRDVAPFDYAAMRSAFGGPWMVNNGYDRAMAIDAVAGGRADLVAFGRAFIANPDLGRRLREDAPLNAPDRSTFYGGGAAGYTDYPTLDAVRA